MLVIDRRESQTNSGQDLIRCLRHYDLELSTTLTLPSADAMFIGNGEDGEAMVGVERKRVADVVQSMRDRRLAGLQLRRLLKEYDYVWIVVEGVWRPGRGGEVEELVGKEWCPMYGRVDKTAVSYRQVAAFLNSLSLRARTAKGEPVRVIRTQSPRHTAAEYAALYFGFVDKTWEQHHAHDQIYTEMTIPPRRSGVMVEEDKVTTLWKMVAQIRGLDRRARGVAKSFRTGRGMALAGLNPRLVEEVERWFKEHPTAAMKAWMETGVGKVTAKEGVKVMEEEGV